MFFVLGTVMSQDASSQAFVNGDFENGTLGWSGCTTEIGTAVTYGGIGNDKVAEVDGHLSTDPTDDRVLCQTISGFVAGGVYHLEFQATRRANSSTPDPITCTMTLDNDALYRTVTRSGGYTMVTEGFDFIATRTTHEFNVIPNFEGSYGMVFDNFTITYLYVLPIELVYFNGEAFSDGVQLSWTTATEHDNSFFTVQRSSDNLDFSDVADIEGAGNSSARLDYSIVDPFPVQGVAYYRLRQTDIRGHQTFSSNVPVLFDRSRLRDLEVYPNPSVNGQLWLHPNGLLENAVLPVSITDMQGCLVHREFITLAPGISVDLGQYVSLSKGTYVVSIPYGGKVHSIRASVH